MGHNSENGHNVSLEASGGSVFLNLVGAAKDALIRGAASTQPLGGLMMAMMTTPILKYIELKIGYNDNGKKS